MRDGDSPSKKNEADKLPDVGDIVTSNKRAFILGEIIGTGGYGSVYKASCSTSARLLALKAEAYSKSAIRNEIKVLHAAAEQRCSHMCELYDYGRVGRQFMYIVMTLLGDDLYKLRRDRESQCFSLGTAVRSAIQTLKGIEELHNCGFISRDVKPSNFAIGNVEEGRAHTIFMFDFGLARRYIKNSVVAPSRGAVGWRGTLRYASLNAHNKQDLGRRDDLESWLYMIIEFTNGSLPWRQVHDRAEVGKMKKESRSSLHEELFFNCPAQYDNFLVLIDGLEFEATPPYEEFYAALYEVMLGNGIDEGEQYDWECSVEEMRTPSIRVSEDESTQSDSTAAAERQVIP